MIVAEARWRLALDEDRCVEILEECGFLRNGPGFGLVNLCNVPAGLDAEATERYLRENAAEICGRAPGSHNRLRSASNG
jgi:hypothetical protein